jgi:adenosyl cobinamide kinase/adenosyl cobinamide phosphate guanylyltransferase
VGYLLLLGGARSGKSALAVEIGRRRGGPVTFIATGEAGDDEMAARIARHRAERPAAWRTVEERLALGDAVEAAPPGDLVVVDCLTLWVSNLLLSGMPAPEIDAAAAAAAAALAARAAPAVVVSNEVGMGIVPDHPLGRAFRDALGSVNAAFAARAGRAALLVAGRLLALTPAAGFLEGIEWPVSTRP